ncbi:serine hydrolase [Limosilactobacillus fermentum]|nr:serine hydrolase [Limosilactobacillus fermentum]
MDATTGQVLYAKNANTKLAIASISKIITVGVIEQEIKAGKLSWNTKVKVTKEEAKLSENTEYSNITLTAGKSYTVKELTEAAMIKSADAPPSPCRGRPAIPRRASSRRCKPLSKRPGSPTPSCTTKSG